MLSPATRGLIGPRSIETGTRIDCCEQQFGKLLPFSSGERLRLLEYGFDALVHAESIADWCSSGQSALVDKPFKQDNDPVVTPSAARHDHLAAAK